jgi:hypothetical protein
MKDSYSALSASLQTERGFFSSMSRIIQDTFHNDGDFPKGLPIFMREMAQFADGDFLACGRELDDNVEWSPIFQ